MNEKIAIFFQKNNLSSSFQADIIEACLAYADDKVILQEHIYMLCHQYSFAHPEEIVATIFDDETVIIAPLKGGATHTRILDGFQDVSLLGLGGMGEVRRVYDQDLQCFVAMKIIHERLGESSLHVDLFQKEAQVLAQLQHPNIPPIHRFGYLVDGRPYFVMREIEGKSLADVNMQFHEEKKGEGETNDRSLYFRKQIDIFRSVCSAVSYAHHKGFLHKDLKPSNIMIGDFSQVLVVDWGLAEALHGEEKEEMRNIEGTPAYMSPEQMRAERLDERSDVFSLGVILYELLLGKPAYFGLDGMTILKKRTAGIYRPRDILESSLGVPEELISICTKAMHADLSERFSSVHELEKEIEGWIDGVQAREKAMLLVAQAEETRVREQNCLVRARELQAQFEQLRSKIPMYASVEEKQELWVLEDELKRVMQEGELQRSLRGEYFQGALIHKADLLEAHLGLMKHYMEEHQKAEQEKHESGLKMLERCMQTHIQHLPSLYAQPFWEYLKGDGALELHVDQDEVIVSIQKYEVKNRRLVLGEARQLGVTPLARVPLGYGSYMLTLYKEGWEEIKYPIYIERSSVWDTRHPTKQTPIQMLPKGILGADDCYVPGSWFVMGGDPNCSSSLPRTKCWQDSFMMKKYPVTNAQYLQFLNHLVAEGLYEESLLYVPRERSGKAGELGAMIYGFEEGKGYFLCPDADGDVWEEEYPVCFIDWAMAQRYAKFYAQQTEQDWRLPFEGEWEKAARGVDGRYLPWGFYLEPSWSCVREASSGRPIPSVVDSFPIDESPYGVRGMAGNMCDWTASVHHKAGPFVSEEGVVEDKSIGSSDAYMSYRGGGWSTQAQHARVTDRGAAFGNALGGNLSFRLACSFSFK